MTIPSMTFSRDPRDYFHHWAPVYAFGDPDLIKSDGGEESTEARGLIGGVVSTEMVDFQGDKVLQKGLNWDYFLGNGWFNDNHDKTILGYPTKVEKGDTETRVEGYLLLDKPRAREFYETAVALKKAETDRTLGYSVEGKILERDPEQPHIITKALVMRVALTEHPVNPGTSLEPLVDMAKSLTAGYQTPASTTGDDNGAYSPAMPESIMRSKPRNDFSALDDVKNVMTVYKALPATAKSWPRAEELYKMCGKDLQKACSYAAQEKPPRKEMPQLSKARLLRVVSKLRKEGVMVKTATVEPSQLSSTQQAINGPKVREMAKVVDKFANDRILVSSDMKILDGHHRVAALRKAGRQVQVYKADMVMNQLIRHPAVTSEAY